MKIGHTDVATLDRPYLIAEIGVNYFDIANQRDVSPLEAAAEMVEEAADAGVDAVKFQSYTARKLASKHSPAYWDTDEESTSTQYELFEKYDSFGAEEFETIARLATEHDVAFLSTPFDSGAVEYLEDLVPAYKMASADITNEPLLRQIARKEKPLILSTGASTIGEIEAAVRQIEDEQSGTPDIALLHCVLEYPTSPENANLRMIEHIGAAFPQYVTGYSDHVPPDEGMITLLHSYVKGADIIEKHFTLDKSLPGNDHYHAMDPDDVRAFRRNVELLEETKGQRRKEPLPTEADARENARRSLVAAEAIAEGERIERAHVAVKRPGTGIPPTMLNVVIGRAATMDIEVDEVLTWKHV